uniref:Ribosomal protein L33 n=1 Tax=Romanomermis culicivorax TaxID=13658 RepID=A0A915HG94_ROMCU
MVYEINLCLNNGTKGSGLQAIEISVKLIGANFGYYYFVNLTTPLRSEKRNGTKDKYVFKQKATWGKSVKRIRPALPFREKLTGLKKMKM